MGKYTPPVVSFEDVLAALPALPMPLALRVLVVPTKNGKGHAYVCVELVYYGSRGEAFVYKRWGRDVRAADNLAVMRAALLAGQEAYIYLEGKDPGELTRFIGWQLGVPVHLG